LTSLKEAIVKKKPVTFANIEADELTLWQVSGFSPLSQMCTHEFLARYLSGAPNSSPTLFANNSSPTKMLYLDRIACRVFSHHPRGLLKGSST